ncbi:MAG: DUF1217 domain-containing protein [Maritimibacter sp.]
MAFQPIIPFGGMAGWNFLQRTRESQQETFNNSPDIKNDIEYFKEHIGEVQTAEDLVSDYRLLKVSLGAFGLGDDLGSKAYIQKVLEEGSLDPQSFANRMADKRYLAMTEAFGFDLEPPNTQLSDFPDKIIGKFQTNQFEIAVGEQNNNMRLSMVMQRELGDIASSDNTDTGKWFAIMGNKPLVQVFQTALGLPSSTSALDLDQQVSVMRDRASRVFGDSEISQFSDADKLEELNRLFLVRSQINANAAGLSSGSIALTLLQGIR